MRSRGEESDERTVRRLAAAHYENFPVASRLVPAAYRGDLAALYAFFRTADDVADEASPLSPKARDAWLSARGRDLRASLSGRPSDDPVVRAAAATVARRSLDPELLLDLLKAFRKDLVTFRYGTLDSLLRTYCRYSANPVGRLVLQLFGHRSEALDRLSDRICSGLQLVNFWQDLRDDASPRHGGGRGRIYLPQDRMRAHGVTAEDLREKAASKRLRALVLEMCDVAEGLLVSGAPLAGRVGGRLGIQLRATVAGGRRVLEKIRRAGGDTLTRRIRLGATDVPGLLLRTLLASVP